MKVWLTQTVLSPYRIPLFRRIAETPGVDFRLILLSDKFKTRPQWKRDVHNLPFKVEVPFGIGYQTGPEHEYCVNPFLLAKAAADRPDVIICGGYGFATLNALLHRKLFRGRYVIWTEATMMADGHIRGARLRLRRNMGRNASAFVDAGSLSREYVHHLVPNIMDKRLFRAFNCVENAQFMKPTEEGRRFLAAQGLPPRTLLFVGKLNERKGIPELLETYRRLTLERPDLGLVLVGDGPLQNEVQEFKSRHNLSHLHLAGFLKNEDTALYYAGASAFLLLSRSDHNPLVLFEALATGIPIICSNFAGNAADFIRNGVNGFTVDPMASDEVVSRTRDLLDWDDKQRGVCAAYSREIVSKANYDDAVAGFVGACRLAVSDY